MGADSQLGVVGVLFVVVVGLGALEDDEEDDEDGAVDEVAPALHAKCQHHLHQGPGSRSLMGSEPAAQSTLLHSADRAGFS